MASDHSHGWIERGSRYHVAIVIGIMKQTDDRHTHRANCDTCCLSDLSGERERRGGKRERDEREREGEMRWMRWITSTCR